MINKKMERGEDKLNQFWKKEVLKLLNDWYETVISVEYNPKIKIRDLDGFDEIIDKVKNIFEQDL